MINEETMTGKGGKASSGSRAIDNSGTSLSRSVSLQLVTAIVVNGQPIVLDLQLAASGRMVTGSGVAMESERQWDDEAMDNVMRIVEESAALASKEKELKDRENALNIRESLMDAKVKVACQIM